MFQIATTVLAISTLASATVMHVVTVGQNGLLQFCPEQITADAGDLVQFQFYPKNHTVTQGFFAKGCTPISDAPPGTAQQGSFSGFMPVSEDSNSTTIPTFTVTVNGTGPEWFYCSQAKHCESGMVFAINPTDAKTLDGYKANCANATENLVPGEVSAQSSPPPAPASAPAPAPGGSPPPLPTQPGKGTQTSLPIQTGSLASSTLSRTASWVVVGLAGCMTFMMML